MSIPVLADPMVAVSPRSRARMIGVVYLLFFLTAVLGAVFTPTTLTAILAQESAFWVGYALTLISTALYVAVTALLYQLFRPVSRSIALMAAFFSLVGCATTSVGSLLQLGPLVILKGGAYVTAFTVAQAQALAQLFLDMHTQANHVALVFFGLFLLLLGYLIFQSTFLPPILAVPIVLAGLGWLTVLAPPLAHQLLTSIEPLGFLAEAILMLWLLVMGVNAPRWTDQARAAEEALRA